MEPIIPTPSPFSQPNNQNLVDEVAVVNKERRSALWKALMFETLSVIFAGLFGYCFALYLVALSSFWPVLIVLLLWGAVEVMVGLVEENTMRRMLFVLLESVALVIFFHAYQLSIVFIAAAISFLFLAWGYHSIRRELRNTIEIRFFTASGQVVGKVITVAVLFIVLMYASLTTTNNSFFVSESNFQNFFTWTSKLVNDFYPTVPLNGSFGDFAQAVAHLELAGNPQFEALTPSQQDLVISQSENTIIMSFASSSAVAITSSTPTGNAFYSYLASFAAKLQERFNSLFVGAWGIVLFLILRGIGVIVVWVGQLVAVIFYELLLATGFMKIKEESATKETLELN